MLAQPRNAEGEQAADHAPAPHDDHDDAESEHDRSRSPRRSAVGRRDPRPTAHRADGLAPRLHRRQLLDGRQRSLEALVQPSSGQLDGPGPAQACYRVDKGIRLRAPQGLTVYGGTFESEATTPLPGTKGYAVFTVLGGSGLTLESMKLAGVNPGGYHSAMAFAAGITLEGTSGTTIRGVTIDQPFGDGITLLPLRGGADQNDGTIVAPTTNAVIRDVTVSGPGRQGVAFVSVSGAMVTDILVDNPGSDPFDFEASQWNEGSVNVTIDGCATSGGGIFFANGCLCHSQRTKDITVENCSMATPTAGDAILVYNNGGPKNHRGPITFVADRLWCGHSEAVACVQLTGAQVSVSDSILRFPAGTIHEAVYHLAKKSIVSFSQDKVTGYGTLGHASKYSLIQISGGHWVRSPYATP